MLSNINPLISATRSKKQGVLYFYFNRLGNMTVNSHHTRRTFSDSIQSLHNEISYLQFCESVHLLKFLILLLHQNYHRFLYYSEFRIQQNSDFKTLKEQTAFTKKLDYKQLARDSLISKHLSVVSALILSNCTKFVKNWRNCKFGK